MSVSQPLTADAEHLRALIAVCQRLGSERELDALLGLVAREAARLLGAERASVFLLDRERKELWTRVALGSEPLRFDARLGVAGRAALEGTTQRVDDVRSDPSFYQRIDETAGYETRNLLAVPLRTLGGEVMGVLEVLNRRGGPFGTEDEALVGALAAPAAAALETAHLMEELARRRDELEDENAHLWRAVGREATPRAILGASEAIRAMVHTIEHIRDTAVDVLVTGESGTGKELVARAVHFSSPRARKPFVAINCAALPETLVESELFGIEKGVATGVERRSGRFEEAHEGTLFLDEIGELAPNVQAKLLRALQERRIERLGGRRPFPVDVRIVAATNRDLETEVEQGRFRRDLYYRLNVIRIRTPSLREIPEDIPVLAAHFLMRFCREAKRTPKTLSGPVRERLVAYRWPGNVRELANEMQRLAILAPDREVQPADLSVAVRSGQPPTGSVDPAPGTLHEAVEALERRLVFETLDACGGNRARAARALGLSRQGLLNKIERYGLPAPRRRRGRPPTASPPGP